MTTDPFQQSWLLNKNHAWEYKEVCITMPSKAFWPNSIDCIVWAFRVNDVVTKQMITYVTVRKQPALKRFYFVFCEVYVIQSPVQVFIKCSNQPYHPARTVSTPFGPLGHTEHSLICLEIIKKSWKRFYHDFHSSKMQGCSAHGHRGSSLLRFHTMLVQSFNIKHIHQNLLDT